LIFKNHAVNPFVLFTDTWQLGELRSVIRYGVKVSLSRTTSGARDRMVTVQNLGLFRQVPPRRVLADQFGAAASIDRSVAHDAAPGGVVGRDQRLASRPARPDDAARSWLHIVVPRIAAREDRRVGVD
jgi:hypothetical protein